MTTQSHSTQLILAPRCVAVEFFTQPDLPLLEVVARVGFSEASTVHRAGPDTEHLSPEHNESAEDDVLA